MIVKAIKPEWFQDYKLPSMFVAFSRCTFKCEAECGEHLCQNSHLASSPNIEIDVNDVVNTYISNPITKAIVCGGLDPFDQFEDLYELVSVLRMTYHCNDTVVIYTGYERQEIDSMVNQIARYGNIIVKFGRFKPKQPKHYDDVLGVYLASKNQYAVKFTQEYEEL